jgi:hypothetical protein
MYDTRQWAFVADMNYSGATTISDVWLWIKWLYFLPGDFAIKMLVESSHIGPFFEMTYDNYGGLLAGTLSLVTLVLVVGALADWAGSEY